MLSVHAGLLRMRTPIQVRSMRNAYEWAAAITCAATLAAGCDRDITAPAPDETGAQHELLSSGVAQVDAGRNHACALKTTGHIICWGADNYGGNPDDVPDGNFTAVSAGARNCAIDVQAQVTCWPNRGIDPRDHWIAPSGSYKQVSAGGYRACGIRTDESLVCWPGTFAPPGKFKQVSVGDGGICAVQTDGSIACWTCCDTDITPPPGNYVEVSLVDYDRPCALNTEGRLVCWGRSPDGITPTGQFVHLDNGCAIDAAGAIACWYPPVPPAGSYKQMSADVLSPGYGCAVKFDGGLVCWGSDRNGQVSGLPAAPSSLSAMRTSPYVIELSWVDHNVDEPLYEQPNPYPYFQLQRRAWYAAMNVWTAWRDVARPAAPEYVDHTISPDFEYQYRVRVCKSNSTCSSYSFVGDIAAPLVPAPPANATATAVSRYQVELTWQDMSAEETGFQVERRVWWGELPPGCETCLPTQLWTLWQIMDVPPANSTSFIDHTVGAGFRYEYRVSACNYGGCSRAVEVPVTTPASGNTIAGAVDPFRTYLPQQSFWPD